MNQFQFEISSFVWTIKAITTTVFYGRAECWGWDEEPLVPAASCSLIIQYCMLVRLSSNNLLFACYYEDEAWQGMLKTWALTQWNYCYRANKCVNCGVPCNLSVNGNITEIQLLCFTVVILPSVIRQSHRTDTWPHGSACCTQLCLEKEECLKYAEFLFYFFKWMHTHIGEQ